MKRITKQKGITLIALIITIIVMLILVGVTINVAVNSGLFGKSSEAAMETEKNSILEQMLSAVVIDEGGYVNVPSTYSAIVTMLQNQGMTVTPSSIDSNATSVIFEIQGERGTYTYSLTSNGIEIYEPAETEDIAGTYYSYDQDSNQTLTVTKTGDNTYSVTNGYMGGASVSRHS